MLIRTDSYFCMHCKIVHVRRKGDLIMTTGWVCIDNVKHAAGFCSTYRNKLPSQDLKSPFAGST